MTYILHHVRNMPILYAKIPREDFALPTITHALFQEITDWCSCNVDTVQSTFFQSSYPRCPYHVTPLMATLKEQL